MTETPTIWMVRHGESTWNERRLVQGQVSEPALTEKGRLQAEEIARVLSDRPVRAIYSSDLRRAMETALPLADLCGLDVVRDQRLRERCYGTLEGCPSSTLTSELTGVKGGWVIDAGAAPPTGESVTELHRRAEGFLESLVYPDNMNVTICGMEGDVVLFVHGGILRALVAWLDGVAPEQMPWGPIENGHVVGRPLSDATARRNPVLVAPIPVKR